MNKKRVRSINWDEGEKQLFREILREHVDIIENKALDSNTNHKKIKAWQEIYRKFNTLNGRYRQLNQLKIQWKAMKIKARKKCRSIKRERLTPPPSEDARPSTPPEGLIEITILLNPAELLRDTHDTEGMILTSESNNTVMENSSDTYATTSQNSKSVTCVVKMLDKNDLNQQSPVPKRKIMLNNIQERGVKFRKDDDYISTVFSNCKSVREEELNMRRIEMAEEEHAIKMEIHKEKLKSAMIERQILEIKKENEENASKAIQ